MPFEKSDHLPALQAIRLELRKLRDAQPQLPARILGCRLLHWNPELANYRSQIIWKGKPSEFVVYRPLDVRTGGRAHFFFVKVYKIKYAGRAQQSSDPGVAERQYGLVYSDFHPKAQWQPLIAAFQLCAEQAGAIIAAAKGRLASLLPPQTLSVKGDLHRWIFTVYNLAWQAPPGSDLAATQYIPVMGFDAAMNTDESIVYDLDHLRATPWPDVERRLDPQGWGTFAPFAPCYASWQEALPDYFASRIDDIVYASELAMDEVVKELERDT